MQVIQSRDRIEQVHPPSLRATLLLRAVEAEEFVDDFSELVRFILIEPGDAPSDLSDELGREVHLIAPDASEIVGDHLELVYVLSDDGAGASVFVPHEVFALPRWCEVRSLVGVPHVVPSGDAT
ncbi:hypothetical protein [Ideonella alba]|uniref:Uncharacterized protein n=1 Tax=Ideonella alba TaxID=2824118 RepID=A0A941BFL4_9BURK|nr:hypothetical protein [Ideonella alba]MBQ0931172.1 hypothetical protein [Ideonella alba]